jgi:DnaJ-class molecular chaperone
MKDLYNILGVSESADDDAIKKAYRKLAKQNHPDATGGDKRKTERFKEVNEAYSILGDKQKRAEYDRLKHAPVGADGMPQGFDADSFAEVFGQGGGFRGARGGRGVNVEFNGDLGDLFSSLFGGGGGGGGTGGGGFNPFARGGGGAARQRSNRGADLAGVLEVSLREAALGTRRTLNTGGGASVEVQIPSGVDNGGRLRLAGQGAPPPRAGGQPGDLHLEIRVAPDPLFRRNGLDLELDLPLKLAEACLGAKVSVPTVEGPVTVTIPPGTSSGAKLRLRGKGIKRQDGTRGDQICRVEVVVPKIAADDMESRRLVEELDQRTQGAAVRNF